jgi:hypothetical protein
LPSNCEFLSSKPHYAARKQLKWLKSLLELITDPCTTAITFLEGLFPIIKATRIRDRLVEKSRAAYIFDFDTTFKVIAVFDLITVEQGRVKHIMPFYHPSPITNAAKK